ncbi:MAG: hypothetical protein ACMUIA_07450 [bacterium]
MEHIEEASLYFGEGRILIMDDQSSVREALGKILIYLGYEVEFSHDGLEAIQCYEHRVGSQKIPLMRSF